MLTKQYILECLDKYCSFDGLNQEEFYIMVVEPLKEAHCFNNWTYDSGISKGVLIFGDFDFVVKIPFEGYYPEDSEDDHWENENGSWHWSYETGATEKIDKGEWHFVEANMSMYNFEGASGQNSGWDYCEAEAEYFEMAVKENVDFAFAKTEFFGKANNHPIYFQQKCSMFDAERSSRQKEYESRTEKDYNSISKYKNSFDCCRIDEDWLLDFFFFWGGDALESFMRFIEEYSICDLHNGNIGYLHGAPVLVDYSGYEG